MFETYTTITGRVISEPRHHRSGGHGDVVSMRVACTSRRLNRETGRWSDGPSLKLTVVCWRRLAAAVAQVVRRGALIIAHGQLRTDEYVAADGSTRTGLEMTAVSLGLDLAHPRSLQVQTAADEEIPEDDEPADDGDVAEERVGAGAVSTRAGE